MNMKVTRLRHWLLALAASALALTSCDNSSDFPYYNGNTALVTVRPTEGGSFLMQLDDRTTLAPANLSKSPFGDKEVRAIVNYRPEESVRSDVRVVNVLWIDSIRTKLPVAWQGDQNDRLYGNDPIEIVRDWVTVAEDGYLTLRIRTLWGDRGVKHQVNLLTGMNANDPYEVELRHNAMGDTRGREGDAMIAFNLNQLPREQGDSVKLKVHWTSFSGPKEAEFSLLLHPNAGTQALERMTLNNRVE